jgi:hypothetical protein
MEQRIHLSKTLILACLAMLLGGALILFLPGL